MPPPGNFWILGLLRLFLVQFQDKIARVARIIIEWARPPLLKYFFPNYCVASYNKATAVLN